MAAEAIVGLERAGQGGGALALVAVGVGVGPELKQRADEALHLAVCLRAIRARLAHGDSTPLAGQLPAALEAGAVVGEDAFDADPVPGVEALQRGEKGERRVGALVRVDTGKAEPAGVVDGGEDALPAGAARSLAAVACHPVPACADAAELLHVDVHELARAPALVADDRLARGGLSQARAAAAAQDGVHGRG